MTYLIESKLVDFCKSLWPNDEYSSNRKIKNILELNSRPDYVNMNKKIIVEFDGYQHYTKSSVVLKDRAKDKIYISYGYKVIRWPYFVQLETRTILEYFNIDLDIEQTYHHGFIDDNAVRPSDFCIAGFSRFINELHNLKDSSIVSEVLNSVMHESTSLPDINDVKNIASYFKLI